MRLITSDEIRKVCRNSYEAVLVAAQYARKLNTSRLAHEQVDDPDNESRGQQSYKVTSQALYDLADSKIKFKRS